MRILIAIAHDGRRNDLELVIRDSIDDVSITAVPYAWDAMNRQFVAEVEQMSRFDLILYHCGDQNSEYIDFIPKYRKESGRQGRDDTVIILFSGSPSSTSAARQRFNSDPWICVVLEPELRAGIHDFFKHWQPGQEPLSTVFKHGGEEHLAALSILCQGFLVVHAGQREGAEWYRSGISPALEQMGWPQAMADDCIRAALRPDLTDKRDEVADVKWWRDVFDFSGDIAGKAHELRQKVQQEWREAQPASPAELPEAVVDLLNGLAEEEPIKTKMVADAYCAIAERLGGQPCNG